MSKRTDGFDVLVFGGGPAGCAAAIAAARAGARTGLVEQAGCLGGVWTSGLLSYVLDPAGGSPALGEIVGRVRSNDPGAIAGVPEASPVKELAWVRDSFVYDIEAMKLALEELVLEAGVSLRLYTAASTVDVDRGRIKRVTTHSKSGAERWHAAQYVDCTGDGDVGARAGCEYAVGRESDGKTQPMSLLCMVGGVPPEQIAPFVSFAHYGDKPPERRLRELIAQSGHETSYGNPALFHIRDDIYVLMANHLYGYSATDAAALTDATVKARGEVHETVRALQRAGGPWSRLRLLATASQIGIREARRLRGIYTVTVDDLVEGRAHADAVCRVSFPVDIHSLDPEASRGYSSDGVRAKPYDIPLRALVARDVANLTMAGRCISGDFYAHASYRVTGNAVEMGAAAGALSAQAATTGRSPADLARERAAESHPQGA